MFSFTHSHYIRKQADTKALLFALCRRSLLLLLPSNCQNVTNRNTRSSADCEVSTSATYTHTSGTAVPCVLFSFTHASCVAANHSGGFIMFILVLSNMQHEAVWKGSGISVGSAADIVKLTHYKWICNPRVDLNCVYCHTRCVCVRACLFECVLHSCICFHHSLTLLSILLFDHTL